MSQNCVVFSVPISMVTLFINHHQLNVVCC